MFETIYIYKDVVYQCENRPAQKYSAPVEIIRGWQKKSYVKKLLENMYNEISTIEICGISRKDITHEQINEIAKTNSIFEFLQESPAKSLTYITISFK